MVEIYFSLYSIKISDITKQILSESVFKALCVRYDDLPK